MSFETQKFKPTLRGNKITPLGKKYEKSFDTSLHKRNLSRHDLKEENKPLMETDSLLTEKEVSIKRKIWSLPKMEALVHSDQFLSGVYNDMAREGEDKYGYHYNETIMNMIFNDYILNNIKYLQKYKMAVPQEKKRRDKSGIEQLKTDINLPEPLKQQLVKQENYNHNNSLEGVTEQQDNEYYENDDQANDREYLNHRINKQYDTMKEETIETNTNENSNDFLEITTPIGSKDYNMFKDIINQGIDSHLEGFTKSKFEAKETSVGNRLIMNFHKLEIPILIRRLRESGNKEASQWANDIEEYQNKENSGVEETTGAASSGSFNAPLGTEPKKFVEKEQSIAETTTSASSGQYSQPAIWAKNPKKSRFAKKPAWKGGEIIGESNYLIDPMGFKKYLLEMEDTNMDGYDERMTQEGMNSPNDDSRVPMAEAVGDYDLSKVETPFLQRMLADLMAVTQKFSKSVDPQTRQDAQLLQQELVKRGVLKAPAQPQQPVQQPVQQQPVQQSVQPQQPAVGEGEEIDEKSKSKSQQRFMGMVRAIQKGELSPKKVGGDVGKAAKEMNPADVKDFAQTKTGNLPEKVKEDDDTSELAVKSIMKKLSLSELLQWSSDNVLYSTEDPTPKIKEFANSKGVTVNDIEELAEFYLTNNLGYDGNVQTPEQDILADLVDTLKEKVGEIPTEEKIKQEPIEIESVNVTEDENKKAVEYARKFEKELKSTGKQFNQLSDEEKRNLFNKIDKEHETSNFVTSESLLDQQPNSMIADNPTTIIKTMKDIQPDSVGGSSSKLGGKVSSVGSIGGSFGEGVNINEDGFCRKDEVPVAGKRQGDEGACRKKKTVYHGAEEKRKNPHNVEARIKRLNKYEHELESKKDEYKKELENHKKEMENLRAKTKEKSKVTEDKKPSSLVMLDKIKGDNENNFEKDLKNSNIGDVVDMEKELVAKDQIEKVGEKPYELGEKIEKDKINKVEGKEAFNNVGDSDNDKGKTVTKRNSTDKEAEMITLDRGEGMQDINYDLEPSDRFEKRMEKDMGKTIYDQRQDKMEHRAEAPMYNKDTQPVGDATVKKDQFDKDKSGWSDKKGFKMEGMLTGKYYDEYGHTKFVNFKINETEIVEKQNGLTPLNVDGLGNNYTTKVEENFDIKKLMDTYKFFLNSEGKVKMIINTKQLLTETETEKKPAVVNEQKEKMRKLMDYKPSTYLNTDNVKRNIF